MFYITYSITIFSITQKCSIFRKRIHKFVLFEFLNLKIFNLVKYKNKHQTTKTKIILTGVSFDKKRIGCAGRDRYE